MAAVEVIIGGYRLLRRLGVGGMAEAFEAEPLCEGRRPSRVCIKRLLPAHAEDEAIREAFHREARVLETLDHTKIVRVLDHFSDEGSECMVLELVNGVDLRTLLAHVGGRLPADEVQVLAIDLLRALEHAHTPRAGFDGVVHRDVSSSNVLVSVDGEARLTDFGIAKELEGAHTAVSTGLKGKIPYMAPEQMRGERATARTDLFSLGVVLFEALTGRRPFDGSHDVEIMTKVLANERPSVRSLAEGPDVLLGLVEALLAFDPEERPRSAGDALQAFGGLVEEPVARLRLGARAAAIKPTLRTYTPLPFVPREPITRAALPARDEASIPTTRPVALAAARRSRWRFAALAAAILATSVVASGATLGWLRSPSAPSPVGEAEAARAIQAIEAEAAQPTEGVEAAAPDPALVTVPAAEPTIAQVSETALAPAAEPVASSTEPEGVEAPEVREGDAPPVEAATRHGTVRVVVIPWGYVWVDGVPQGRAPRVLRLPEGEHWVGAGIDGIERRKRVVVKAGVTRKIELDLGGGP